MRRHRLGLALAAVVVVTGCGDDDATPTAGTSSNVTDTTTSTTAADGSGPIEVSADVPDQVPAGPVTWELTITNTGDEPVTLTFPTAQQGEAVLSAGGTEVHRFGEGRFFTQVISDLTLEPAGSETIRLEDDLSAVEPGTYELTLEPTVQSDVGAVTEQVEVVPAG